jgi:4-hydroxybenzoyl-CoA thioesterase
MISFERAVLFEEVDSAQIVFFARFFGYAHDAMERFFGALEGGYPRLVSERRIGMPAVHVESTFHVPLRYGDAIRIETSVARLGRRSAVLRYRMFRKRDGALSAEVRHTVVCSDLNIIASRDMPADVRALFEAHVEPDPSAAA